MRARSTLGAGRGVAIRHSVEPEEQRRPSGERGAGAAGERRRPSAGRRTSERAETSGAGGEQPATALFVPKSLTVYSRHGAVGRRVDRDDVGQHGDGRGAGGERGRQRAAAGAGSRGGAVRRRDWRRRGAGRVVGGAPPAVVAVRSDRRRDGRLDDLRPAGAVARTSPSRGGGARSRRGSSPSAVSAAVAAVDHVANSPGRRLGASAARTHRHLAGDVGDAAQRRAALHAELLSLAHLRAARMTAHRPEPMPRARATAGVPPILAAVTGRFAPSPTGPLHVGNLRTALAAWLLARSAAAAFVVRMEDLDRVTASREHEAAPARRAGGHRPRLGRAGGAPAGALRPLPRGHRRARRRRADVRVLLHPPRDPRGGGGAARRRGRLPGHVPRPVGRRAGGPPGARPPALRLRAPARRSPSIDTLAGPYTAVPDDVVLRRNDGVPAYNLAVVVDDAAQGIDQVVRGDDLLASTPRQALLQDLLGLPRRRPTPTCPLVVGADGQRLAKRHGAVDARGPAAAGVDRGGRRGVSPGRSASGRRPATPIELVATLWTVGRSSAVVGAGRRSRSWSVLVVRAPDCHAATVRARSPLVACGPVVSRRNPSRGTTARACGSR